MHETHKATINSNRFENSSNLDGLIRWLRVSGSKIQTESVRLKVSIVR